MNLGLGGNSFLGSKIITGGGGGWKKTVLVCNFCKKISQDRRMFRSGQYSDKLIKTPQQVPYFPPPMLILQFQRNITITGRYFYYHTAISSTILYATTWAHSLLPETVHINTKWRHCRTFELWFCIIAKSNHR